MTIKISALLMNKEDEGETVCILDHELTGIGPQTLEAFVAQVVNRDGGVFLNKEKTDWIPAARILRVWQP